MVKPALSGTETLPLAKDLVVYWGRIECTVGGVGDTIHMDKLERQHILQIGKIILGDAV